MGKWGKPDKTSMERLVDGTGGKDAPPTKKSARASRWGPTAETGEEEETHEGSKMRRPETLPEGVSTNSVELAHSWAMQLELQHQKQKEAKQQQNKLSKVKPLFPSA